MKKAWDLKILDCEIDILIDTYKRAFREKDFKSIILYKKQMVSLCDKRDKLKSIANIPKKLKEKKESFIEFAGLE